MAPPGVRNYPGGGKVLPSLMVDFRWNCLESRNCRARVFDQFYISSMMEETKVRASGVYEQLFFLRSSVK
jgi:hypothetical protein